MAVDGITDSRFLSIITPVSVKDNLLYLPQDFVSSRGEQIPWRCFLRVSNGDFFEVRFLKNSHAFVGVKRILQRYRATSYCFILFDYIGGPEFTMELFSCYAVEVEYPLPGTNQSLLEESLSYLHPLSEPTVGVHNFTLVEDIEYELLRFNCLRDNGVSFEIMMSSPEMLCGETGLVLGSQLAPHIQSWEDDSFVTLQIGHRFWAVQMSRDVSGCYLRNGWEVVVREVGFQLGDLCVFRKDNSMRKFRVAVFKQHYMLCGSVVAGSLFGRRFLILATPRSITAGEIHLPRVFMQLFGNLLNDEVLVVHSSGKNCIAQYSANSQALLGLGSLVRSLNTDVGDLYLFKYTLAGLLYLAVIKEGAPEVLF